MTQGNEDNIEGNYCDYTRNGGMKLYWPEINHENIQMSGHRFRFRSNAVKSLWEYAMKYFPTIPVSAGKIKEENTDFWTWLLK